ncbi:MAG: hypothetical protein PHC61_16530 [Chitinivibrionales bacterium]|nr:hypothetical protein [Chitinivibrionales bacterium]
MKSFGRLFAASLLLTVSIFCPAGAAYITTTVDRDSFYVGDPVALSITLIVPPKASVLAPPFDKGDRKIVVKSVTPFKTERKSSDSLRYAVVFTSYTVEPCTLAALAFVVTTQARAETLYSAIKPLKVISLVSSDTAGIKDLKPPQSAGAAPLTWLYFLLFVLFLLAGVWLTKRYAHKKIERSAPPPKAPFEEALEALALLDARQLIIKGLFREHVFILSDIFKRYIERRFGVNAAEFTTSEMLDWIQSSALPPAPRKSGEWFFKTTDPIKFAKMVPERDIAEQLGREVRAFLDQTHTQEPSAAVAAEGPLSPQAKGGSHAV